VEYRFEVIAKTLYGETRDTHVMDRLAIAAIIRERVLRPGDWGNDWISVCQHFSCWMESGAELETIDAGFAEDTSVFMAFMQLTSYILKHFTDEDLEPIFGTSLPVTHYHREGYYPAEWEPGYTQVQVNWDSKFVFYSDPNAPGRSES
jgi:hypothetical protein